MMKQSATVIIGFVMLCASAMGFFIPLTIEKRIAASSLIAVVKVTKVDEEKGRSGATVIEGILGAKAGEEIEIWDDWKSNKDGAEYRIDGRDPYLEVGKIYLIYLAKNAKGRLVTVQSSLDSLKVVGDKVKKEGGEGFEPLADKLADIRAALTKRKEAEHGTASDGDKPPN